MAYLFFIHLFTIYHAEGHYPLRYLSALIRPLGLPAYTNSDETALRRTDRGQIRANVPLCLFPSEVVSDFKVSKCIVRLSKRTWPTFPENTGFFHRSRLLLCWFLSNYGWWSLRFDHSYATVVCSVKARGSSRAQVLFAFQNKADRTVQLEKQAPNEDQTPHCWDEKAWIIE